MDEQERFQTALAILCANAEKKGWKLTKKELEAFFQEMGLREGQYGPVYAYLSSKRIQVEGAGPLETACREAPYTEEEKEFLERYQRALRKAKKQPKDALQELFLRAADELAGPEELSRYLDMPVEEIEELLRIAGYGPKD